MHTHRAGGGALLIVVTAVQSTDLSVHACLRASGVLPEMFGQTRDGTAFNATVAVNIIGWLALTIMTLVGSPDAVTIFLNTMTLCWYA